VEDELTSPEYLQDFRQTTKTKKNQLGTGKKISSFISKIFSFILLLNIQQCNPENCFWVSSPQNYCGLLLPHEKDITKSLADYSVLQPMY
jgi:hypothetical protein